MRILFLALVLLAGCSDPTIQSKSTTELIGFNNDEVRLYRFELPDNTRCVALRHNYRQLAMSCDWGRHSNIDWGKYEKEGH